MTVCLPLFVLFCLYLYKFIFRFWLSSLFFFLIFYYLSCFVIICFVFQFLVLFYFAFYVFYFSLFVYLVLICFVRSCILNIWRRNNIDLITRTWLKHFRMISTSTRARTFDYILKLLIDHISPLFPCYMR